MAFPSFSSPSIIIVNVLILLIFSEDVAGFTSFCTQYKNHLYSADGILITRRSPSEYYYGAGRVCDWTLVTGNGRRFALRVTLSDLDRPFDAHTCSSEDHITIYDGSSLSAPILASWCHDNHPWVILSSSSSITVVFRSNARSTFNAKGIQLQYSSFNSSSECPDGFHNAKSTDSCYKVVPEGETWKTAQEQCIFARSNLVHIASENFNKDIMAILRKEHRTWGHVWIGLYRISSRREFRWLDERISFSHDVWISPMKVYDEEGQCVALNTETGGWSLFDCRKNIFPFLCQYEKGELFQKFNLPDLSQSEHVEIAMHGWVIWVTALTVASSFCSSIVFFVYRKTRHAKFHSTRKALCCRFSLFSWLQKKKNFAEENLHSISTTSASPVNLHSSQNPNNSESLTPRYSDMNFLNAFSPPPPEYTCCYGDVSYNSGVLRRICPRDWIQDGSLSSILPANYLRFSDFHLNNNVFSQESHISNTQDICNYVTSSSDFNVESIAPVTPPPTYSEAISKDIFT